MWLKMKLHPDAPTVIWDCVDLNRFSPGKPDPKVLAKYGIPNPEENFIVLSLGRLARKAAHKGFDRLIEVMGLLMPKYPNLRLVIAGTGDDRERLDALVRERSIKDRVTFTGSVHENELVDVYRSAHMFSLVSDKGPGRGEGLPLTLLEANACGAPIIAGNEDGSREGVVDGQNGFVISPRDLATHAQIIESFMNDPAKLAEMTSASRRVSQENFGYDMFVEKHRSFHRVLETSA